MSNIFAVENVVNFTNVKNMLYITFIVDVLVSCHLVISLVTSDRKKISVVWTTAADWGVCCDSQSHAMFTLRNPSNIWWFL